MKIKKTAFVLLMLMLFTVSTYAANIGVVNTDVLNFRSGPGTGYELLGQFVRGEMMKVTENVDSEWSKVDFNGRIGYVATRYLSIRQDNPTDRSGAGRSVSVETSGYSIASVLNFRKTPSTEAEVLAKIPQYTQFWVVENTDNDWYKIYYNDSIGYVSSQYVAMGQAPYVASKGDQVVKYAEQFLGKPYVYGGNGPNSFDCSGFAKYIYSHFGINLSRTSYSQVNEGYYVSKDNLQAGDLVFFKSGGSVSHVGIYIANGMMIHASSPGDYVKYDSITSGYYNNHYYTARRVL